MMSALRSTLGKLLVTYLEKVPTHRGQARMVNLVGRVLGPVPMRCASDTMLLLRLDSSMDRSYVVREHLNHPELMSELERLRPGDTFVDVGANAGLYTMIAARALAPGGRVLAFEPSRDEFQRLAWAVLANGISNVQAFNFALADANGFSGFVPSPDSHTGLHHLSTSGTDATARVWTQRGDDSIALRPGEHIALLKVDVEGAELIVLRGFDALLRAGAIKRLVVEITDKFLRRFGGSATELYSYLSERGYRPQRGLNDSWQYDEVFILRDHQ